MTLLTVLLIVTIVAHGAAIVLLLYPGKPRHRKAGGGTLQGVAYETRDGDLAVLSRLVDQSRILNECEKARAVDGDPQ